MRIEETILSNLITSEAYCRKVLPFLKGEYFSIRQESALFNLIFNFVNEYNSLPTKESLKIDASNRKDLSDDELHLLVEFVDGVKDQNTHKEWLIDETEKFCRQRAIYNSIMQSIQIIDGKDKKYKEDAIPKLLQDALAVSFDTSVGHDYFSDVGSRFDFYSNKDDRIPYGLSTFNKVFDGLYKKALTVIVAQSGGGKSLCMCHHTADFLKQGKNVLYITLEMSENKIAERIDANLLRTDIKKLIDIGRDSFVNQIEKIKEKSRGRLFIKEYPPSSASVTHFHTLLNELKVKQDFTPDIIVVDYLGIMASATVKLGSTNSNTYLGEVTKELRGLAIVHDIPILTGGQLNRGGFNNSDVEESNLADAINIFFNCDVMYAAIRTPELDELEQLMIKQLKNRYGDPNFPKRFIMGINRSRMMLYDLEGSAQLGLLKNNNEIVRKEEAPKFVSKFKSKNGLESLNF